MGLAHGNLYTRYMRTTTLLWLSRVVKYGALLLGGVFVVMVFYMAAALRFAPLDPHKDVVLRKDGGLFQGENKVGQLIPNNDWVEGQLPVVVSTTEGEESVRFAIRLEAALDDAVVEVRPISIQNTIGMTTRTVQRKPAVIEVNLPNLVNDGHTVINIRSAADLFKINPLMNLAGWLHGLPKEFWLSLSAVLVLLAELAIMLAAPRMRLEDKEEVRPELLTGITPIEAAVFMHSRLYPQDLAAILFDLAHRGYLQMVQRHKEGEMLFFRSGEGEELLPEYEQKLLKLVAPQVKQPNTLRQVMGNLDASLFSQAVSAIYVEVYNSFTKQGYVRTNPRKLHVRYKAIGILVQLMAVVAAGISYFYLSASLPYLTLLAASMYIVGLAVYRTGYELLPLTEKGRSVNRALAAFKRYLSLPERVRSLEAQEGELLYRFLPYAMVFGMERQWLDRFATARCLIPKWFTAETDIYDPAMFTDLTEEITVRMGEALVKVKDPNVD